MSYIRWGEQGSKVYVYKDVDARLVCCACDGPMAVTTDLKEFLGHLKWHRDQGDVVPQCVEERLNEEHGRLSHE